MGDQLGIGPKESAINVVFIGPKSNHFCLVWPWRCLLKMVILLLMTAGNSLLAALGQFAGFLQKNLTAAWPFFYRILRTSCSDFGDSMNPHDANDFFVPLGGCANFRQKHFLGNEFTSIWYKLHFTMKGSLKTLLSGKCCHSWQKKIRIHLFLMSFWCSYGGKVPH